MSLKKSVVLILCFSLFLSIVNGESTTTVAYHGIRPTDPKGYVGLRNPDRGFRMETRFGEGPYDSIRMNPRYAVRLANRDVQWWRDDKGEYGINLIGLAEVVK